MADQRRRRSKNPNGSGTISQRKDGLYELKVFVDTPDGKRKRISVYGKTWDEADAERTRIKEMQRKGIPVDVTTLTVKQYLDYWLEEMVRPNTKDKTYATYEPLVRLYVIPGVGKVKLRKLETRHLRSWLTALRGQCQCCTQGKDSGRAQKGMARCCALEPVDCCRQYPSAGTLRVILRMVRAAMQDAVDEELIVRNVARQVKMPSGPIRKVEPWSAEEATRFLEVAREDRLHALWAVALAIGLRRGEALGLRWSDVDLANGRVNVAVSLSRVRKELALREVKTESSAASVPLTDELVRILRVHRRGQLADTKIMRANKDGLVFTTKNGTPLEPRNINRAFTTLCRRAGVREIRLHDLRHSCATLLFTMGTEAATVQRILRHSSIEVTTGTYMKVIDQVQRAAVANMDRLLKSDGRQSG